MAESYAFTTDIRRVLRRARDNAVEHGDPAIEPTHLLYGLTQLAHARACAVLTDLGADLRDLQLLAGGPIGPDEDAPPAAAATQGTRGQRLLDRVLRRPPPAPPAPPADVQHSTRTTRVLQLTLKEFEARGDADCDTDHLLLGMLALPNDRAAALLASSGVDLTRARSAVARLRAMPRP